MNTLAPEIASTRPIMDQYTAPVEVHDARGLTDVDLLPPGDPGRGLDDAERRRAVQSVMELMDYCCEPLFPLFPELVLCLPRERRGDYALFV